MVDLSACKVMVRGQSINMILHFIKNDDDVSIQYRNMCELKRNYSKHLVW